MFKNNVKIDFELISIDVFNEILLLNSKKRKEINIFA